MSDKSVPNPAGHGGLLDNLLALANALSEFFADRFAPFTQESRAALLRVVVLMSCLILAVVLFQLGCIFLIASAVVGVADLAGISWAWTALVAAGAHFVIALILLLIARNRITNPFFRTTVTELKKDREWLKNLNLADQPTS
jgi:cell division protein FtsW (lipid II flippase)